MKKMNDDIMKALDKCVDAITIAELSIRTGVKLETLKRFVKIRNRNSQADVFAKVYPEIRKYFLLKDADEAAVRPIRIGAPPKMGHYLDDLISDEKIMIDAYNSLNIYEQEECINSIKAITKEDDYNNPSIDELNKQENLILGLFRAIEDDDMKLNFLLDTVNKASVQIKKRRVGI